MIVLEVLLNGHRVALAGADDLAVLSAFVSASGKLGPRSCGAVGLEDQRSVTLSVGGLSARPANEPDEHLDWVKHHELAIGDVVMIKLHESSAAADPVLRKRLDDKTPEISEKEVFEIARERYFQLREKYEG